MQFPSDPTALPQEILFVSCVLRSDPLGRQVFFQQHVDTSGIHQADQQRTLD